MTEPLTSNMTSTRLFYHQISQIKLRLNELVILVIEDKRDDERGGGENEG